MAKCQLVLLVVTLYQLYMNRMLKGYNRPLTMIILKRYCPEKLLLVILWIDIKAS